MQFFKESRVKISMQDVTQIALPMKMSAPHCEKLAVTDLTIKPYKSCLFNTIYGIIALSTTAYRSRESCLSHRLA